MDRRTLVALLLTAIVIVVTPMLFPSPKRPAADSTAIIRADTTAARPATTSAPRASAPAPSTVVAPGQLGARPSIVRAETTVVSTKRASYAIASPGAVPVDIALPDYASLRAGVATKAPVHLIDAGDRLFHLRIATERDTIALDTVAFRAEAARPVANGTVQSFTSTSISVPITLTYTFPADSFLTHVTGVLAGGGDASIMVSLPSRIRSEEANLRDDVTHLSVAYKRRTDDVTSVSFRQLDTVTTRADTGAIRWIAERNKYFIVAIVPDRRRADSTFRTVQMRGGSRSGKDATAV